MLSRITKSYTGKTILINGGRGYLGSSLTQKLAQIKCKLILLDNSSDSWFPNEYKANIELVKGDISNFKIWKSILFGVDYIFHLAALEYNRINFNVLRDYKINSLSIGYMLEACRINKISPKIIFTSSVNIYKSADKPVNEKTDSEPISLWSAHKLLAENYLKIYYQKYGIRSVVLRLSNIYGPCENKNKLINTVINSTILKALNNNKLTVFSNYSCFRDYIYIDDVVNALLIAGANNKLPADAGRYIVGSGEKTLILNVWKLIAKKIKKLEERESIIFIDKHKKLEPFDYRNFTADFSLFNKYTKWMPKVSLDKGIDYTIKMLNDAKN